MANKIYDQGGHGIDLARARIKLEIATATGKEQERLTEALDHRGLRK